MPCSFGRVMHSPRLVSPFIKNAGPRLYFGSLPAAPSMKVVFAAPVTHKENSSGANLSITSFLAPCSGSPFNINAWHWLNFWRAGEYACH